MDAVLVWCGIGFVLSVYAFYIDRKLKSFKNYKSICDFNDRVSCTRALASHYGKFWGIPNSILGVGFYLLVMILWSLHYVLLTQILVILAFLGTLYLAYVLYSKLKDFCIVCTAIYVVNFALMIVAF